MQSKRSKKIKPVKAVPVQQLRVIRRSFALIIIIFFFFRYPGICLGHPPQSLLLFLFFFIFGLVVARVPPASPVDAPGDACASTPQRLWFLRSEFVAAQ